VIVLRFPPGEVPEGNFQTALTSKERRKKVKKRILFIALALVLALSISLIACNGGQQEEEEEEEEPIVVGYIGPYETDCGISGRRGVEIAVDEINENGGILGGRPLELVSADSTLDPVEGIKAYDYLATAGVDFIISGGTDDVSLGWMPRLAEHKIPTIDTWTTAIMCIDLLVDDYEAYKSYFMMVPNDWFMGMGMIDVAASVFKEQLGWETTYLFQEDTAFGHGVAEFVVAEMLPLAGIELVEHVVFDPWTWDFTPFFSDFVDKDPDYVFVISTINSLVPIGQYVEHEVPVPLTGLWEAPCRYHFWDDVGGKGIGVSSTMPPIAWLGLLDDETEAFISKYEARYNTRPRVPMFNGINCYYAVYMAVQAAEQAGGFEPLDDWVTEMEDMEYKLYRDGEVWYNFDFYKPDEYDAFFERYFPHAAKYDVDGVVGVPGAMGIQWLEDGTAELFYPPKYATGTFTLPPWIS